MSRDAPKITFEDDMQESMLPMFGWTTDEDNIVVDKNGDPVPVYGDKGPLEPDEIAGFIKHPRTGEDMLLRDNFCDMVDYVSERKDYGELRQFTR